VETLTSHNLKDTYSYSEFTGKLPSKCVLLEEAYETAEISSAEVRKGFGKL